MLATVTDVISASPAGSDRRWGDVPPL